MIFPACGAINQVVGDDPHHIRINNNCTDCGVCIKERSARFYMLAIVSKMLRQQIPIGQTDCAKNLEQVTTCETSGFYAALRLFAHCERLTFWISGLMNRTRASCRFASDPHIRKVSGDCLKTLERCAHLRTPGFVSLCRRSHAKRRTMAILFMVGEYLILFALPATVTL